MKLHLNLFRVCVSVLSVIVLATSAFADIDVFDFGEATGMQLLGDASVEGSRLRVAPEYGFQRGAAWFEEKQQMAEGFEARFQFEIFALRFDEVADGFAFVIQNHSLSALGPDGGKLGYHGIPNSVALEFDTIGNPQDADPNGNHISLQTRGIEPNSVNTNYSLGLSTDIPIMENSGVHEMRVRYTPGAMDIFFDDMANPLFSVTPLDLDGLLDLDDGSAWVGFTGATGAGAGNHDILNFNYTAVPEPGTLLLMTVGGLFVSRIRAGRRRLNPPNRNR
jgi:hypothetical protein